MKSISKSADLKLVLIPLIFVLLRVWGVVVDIFTLQIPSVTLKDKFEQSVAGQIMIVLKVNSFALWKGARIQLIRIMNYCM